MVDIYFNDRDHSYKTESGRSFISSTTLISQYHEGFDSQAVAEACARIGQTPDHPKFHKYAGKSVSDILKMWDKTSKTATDKGTRKHDWIERSIKESTGVRISSRTSDDPVKLLTVENIITNPNVGVMNIEELSRRMESRYPLIFEHIKELHERGFRFFAEICIFNLEYMISGLIDLLAVKGKEFVIFDWKTNKSEIRYESGYFAKDLNGEVTENFIFTEEWMLPPIEGLPDSVGTHYALQISLYTWMLEQFGFKNVDTNLIFQIRDVGSRELVTKYSLPDYTKEVKLMIEDYKKGKKR